MVVFFYGGSWRSGARGDDRFLGEALVAQGVRVLVADYRLYPEVRFPDVLADSAQALAYGMDHVPTLGTDPHRVFVMGHSAGGDNAAMLALDARWLRATGAPVTLRLYEGASHATLIGAFAWPLRWVGPVLADVRALIDATPPARRL